MKTIEIIVPCFNEEECVHSFIESISEVMDALDKDYDWSIVFVDDGSYDKTLEVIKSYISEEQRNAEKIKYISLARNFGKEGAMYAGLEKSTADCVIVMDADLQHPPKLIPEMLEVLENEDYDCVGTRRVSRLGEPFVKSVLSRWFYHVINWITGMGLVPGMTDYRAMKRKVVNAIVSMSERERFTKGIYSWIGFRTKWIEYENVERSHGVSKWSIKSLMSYAGSGFIAFATTPLRGVVYLGMIVVLMSFIYGIKLYIQVKSGSRIWYDTTTIILLLLFIGGVIITILGLVGEYIARIYMEVKGRPIYIERETNIK